MRKTSLFLFLIVLLSGCVSAEVTTNKAPDFDQKIDNVLVIMRGSSMADPFFSSMKSQMAQEFTTHGITSNIYITNPVPFGDNDLSLESEEEKMKQMKMEIEKQILLAGPDYIMFITQTLAKDMNQDLDTQRGGVYDIRLFSRLLNKMVWRAKLDSYSGMGPSENARIGTEKLFDKMQLDQLLL
ncbi:MAG: hypothetical protein ACQETE_13855 [Bacteroidota bacterium]